MGKNMVAICDTQIPRPEGRSRPLKVKDKCSAPSRSHPLRTTPSPGFRLALPLWEATKAEYRHNSLGERESNRLTTDHFSPDLQPVTYLTRSTPNPLPIHPWFRWLTSATPIVSWNTIPVTDDALFFCFPRFDSSAIIEYCLSSSETAEVFRDIVMWSLLYLCTYNTWIFRSCENSNLGFWRIRTQNRSLIYGVIFYKSLYLFVWRSALFGLNFRIIYCRG